jgi:transcriptional regulator with XRE-family HTH domain
MAHLWNKLRDKRFRDAFVVSQFKRSIPFQITVLRKKLDWSQEQLAEAAKVTQGVISRAENPNYGNLTLNTILRVANGFDVGVVIEFVPFSRLLQIFEDRAEDQAPTSFEVENRAALQKEELEQPATERKNQTIIVPTRQLNLTGMNEVQSTASITAKVIRAAVGSSVGQATVEGVSEAMQGSKDYVPATPGFAEISQMKTPSRNPLEFKQSNSAERRVLPFIEQHA